MRKSSIVLPVFLLILVGAVQAQTDAHWPQWRGPFFNGMARGDAPAVWSDTKNIKWKAEIPGRGFSTPVMWGDRIFLTTAIPTGKAETPQPAPAAGRRAGGGAGPLVEHRFEVLCLDRKTGKILWQRTAKTATPHEGYHRAYGSFASNSPITDGKYVYAFFGSRGLYAYDFNGKLIWEKDFGVQMKMRLAFGEGAAPLLLRDQLFVVFDHEGGSFIVAVDKRDGKELWRSARDESSSWSTPLAIEHNGRTEIVVSATNKVRSYDARSGKILWESAGLGSNVIPVPVTHNGMVFVMSGHRDPKLMAIKLGKEGDLTGSDAIAWSHTRGLAYTTSPVLYDNKLYVVTDSGMVSAFNATTGEPYYAQTRLPKASNLKASPVGANGKLYLATEDGDVVVLKMGEKFEVLSVNTLEDQVFIATPVIADGELYLRGQNTLFCISEKK
ncbi:MAG TPA: PQQ-binding-like beta-propeller repeat protein [Pyrinomonadaceae bacterium]|nr:PQQ-binding-like beta-propeller repeat protein [Pyrinomonadaceae bacterium]